MISVEEISQRLKESPGSIVEAHPLPQNNYYRIKLITKLRR